MTSFAVIKRKSDFQVAYAAKLIVQYVVHPEMFGGFLLDIEDIRMAV